MSCRLFFVCDVFVLLLILLVSLLHLVLLLSRKTMGTQAPKKYKSGNLNPSATAAFRQSPNLELHVLSWQEPSPASWSTSTRITSHTFSHHNSQPAWRHICIPSSLHFLPLHPMLPVSLAPRRGAKKMVEVEVEVPQLQQTKVERIVVGPATTPYSPLLCFYQQL